jgi:hypothetical protein
MDPVANNFNPLATWEDGSCCYLEHYVTFSSDQIGQAYVVGLNSSDNYAYFYFPGTYTYCVTSGCYVTQLYNYEFQDFACTLSIDGQEPFQLLASELNGLLYEFSLGENIISGCMDPSACNYDASATCNSGLCDYSCLGCTDPAAPNYNPTATLDDGSCCSNDNWYTLEASGACYISFYSDYFGFLGGIDYPEQTGVCLPVNCVQVNVHVYNTLEAFTYQIFDANGNVAASGELIDNMYGINYIGTEGSSVGCGDINACNYDSTVTCIDNSTCTYDCFGCTDPTSPNYNPEATVDNGTCCSVENWLTISVDQTCTIYIASQYVENYYFNYFWMAAGTENQFCLPDGCYQLQVIDAFTGTSTQFTVSDESGTVLLSGASQNGEYFGTLSKNGVIGCNNPNACNYDPAATCLDYTLCDFSCFGCTNPEAGNYNPDATIDDGSCCNQALTISMTGVGSWSLYSYSNYFGFNGSSAETSTFCILDGCFYIDVFSNDGLPVTVTVTNSDGIVLATLSTDETFYASATFGSNDVQGCTDYNACNFNPDANCSDNSCDYSCYGCTDSSAPNFNPAATIDNGSCCTASWFTIETSEPVYWSSYSLNNYGFYNSGVTPDQNGFCRGEDCFSFSVVSMIGNQVSFTIYDGNGNIFYSGNTDEYGNFNMVFSQGDIYGCTDMNACNYDPNVTCSDWYACDFSCYGCTNPEAGNYDPNATIDNGLCCVSDWYTLEMDNAAYWYTMSPNNYGNGGTYPTANGFCETGSCFGLYVYAIYGETVNFSIIDPNGNVVFTGTTGENNMFQGSISIGGEIAGCTDVNSCNYNAEATCNDGSCNYYCGGCLDAAAINYNPIAWFDDGSCFYSPESPMMQLVVDSDPFADVYYVRMEVMDLGNGAPYLLSSDYNTDMLMIDENGQYIAGPFPCGEDVVISMNSAQLGMMEYMVSDPLMGACSVTTSVSEMEETNFSLYPNPSSGQLTLTGLESGSLLMEIFDMTGRTVFSQKQSIGSNNLTLLLNDLNNGAYQVRITNNGQVSSKQLLIAK